MLMYAAMTLGGLVVLAFGADFLVRGSVALAKRFGVSPLVIGLTIVAFGTSLPELTVSLQAAHEGAVGLAIGNVVGSNIANILLILGTAAAISPVVCSKSAVLRDGMAMLGGTTLFVVLGMTTVMGIFHGIGALLLLGGYLLACYFHDRQHSEQSVAADEVADIEEISGSLGVIAAKTVGGLVAVIVGAELLVDGAVGIARALNVSEEVIGLTLVAFGTSVPELATTIVAALRRHADVALGNVLGSNLFNIFLILGSVTLFVPVDLAIDAPKIAAFDIWIMLATTVILFPLMATGWRLSRLEGGLFLLAYAGFLTAAFTGVGNMMMTMVFAS